MGSHSAPLQRTCGFLFPISPLDTSGFIVLYSASIDNTKVSDHEDPEPLPRRAPFQQSHRGRSHCRKCTQSKRGVLPGIRVLQQHDSHQTNEGGCRPRLLPTLNSDRERPTTDCRGIFSFQCVTLPLCPKKVCIEGILNQKR